MDLPVIETSIRATLKRKPRKCLQGIGEKEPGLYYHMQPRKWQVAFYYIIELMEWITALTALIHLSAVGPFTGDEWYSPSPTCLDILLCFSFIPLPCCCSLKSSIADAVNSLFSLPHIWTSDHQLHLSLLHILPVWDASWAIYELNVTEVCKLYSKLNSRCSWVKRENEIWLQVITLCIKMLHHTWFWGLTCHLLKLIISSRTNMITNFPKIGWKHADNWY